MNMNKCLVGLLTLLLVCGCSSSQVLKNGSILWVEESRCSVSIAQEGDKKVALTAGHCGSVGSRVYIDGLEIGKVVYNYLDNENSRDISILDLNDSVELEGRPVVYSQNVDKNEKIFIGKAEGVVGEFHLKSVDFSWDSALRELSLQAIDYSGEPGESGAPVVVNGSLVGIVQGGNRKSTTYIEDIPEDLFSRV